GKAPAGFERLPGAAEQRRGIGAPEDLVRFDDPVISGLARRNDGAAEALKLALIDEPRQGANLDRRFLAGVRLRRLAASSRKRERLRGFGFAQRASTSVLQRGRGRQSATRAPWTVRQAIPALVNNRE